MAGEKQAILFGGRTEMLIDDYLVERLENTRFEINAPVRREEVLLFQKPWEGKGSLACTAFRHQGQVYLYYRGFPDGADDFSALQAACLAVSTDGAVFQRAGINRIAYGTSKRNNIVWLGPEAHNFMPFVDTNPACPPGERFKAVAGLQALGGRLSIESASGQGTRLVATVPLPLSRFLPPPWRGGVPPPSAARGVSFADAPAAAASAGGRKRSAAFGTVSTSLRCATAILT